MADLNAFAKRKLRYLVELSTSLQDVRSGKNERQHELRERLALENSRLVAVQSQAGRPGGFAVDVAEQKIRQLTETIRDIEETRDTLLQELEEMGADCNRAGRLADKVLVGLDPDTFAPVAVASSSFAPHSLPAGPTHEEFIAGGLASLRGRRT